MPLVLETPNTRPEVMMAHDEAMPRLSMNQSRLDRAFRVGLGLTLFGLGLTGLFAEPLAGALRVASIVPLATAALGWCPIYDVLGFSTRRRREPRATPGFESGVGHGAIPR